jgi:hypothetical protein
MSDPTVYDMVKNPNFTGEVIKVKARHHNGVKDFEFDCPHEMISEYDPKTDTFIITVKVPAIKEKKDAFAAKITAEKIEKIKTVDIMEAKK